ncbi:MAG: phage/plasmid primase, P4 family, partial [Clostridia bacterium]|nr:phage/plasmid primase, P4 family [Clostridia bacterium]
FGVDLDDIENDNDKMIRDEFIAKLNSYTEISQSGKGIHIICRGKLPEGNRRKGNIEMYDSGRYLAMTGNIYPNTSLIINDCTNIIFSLHEKYLADKVQNKISYVVSHNDFDKNGELKNSILTDEEVINKIKKSKQATTFYALWNGDYENLKYQSHSDADGALCMILAFWCSGNREQIDRLFRKSGLMRDKWDEKRGELTYGEITINSVLNKITATYDPNHYNEENYYVAENGALKENKLYAPNDTGNAQMFYELYKGLIKYNVEDVVFMVYNAGNGTWERDSRENIRVKIYADLMIEIMHKNISHLSTENNTKEYQANIKHLSSTNGKDAMLKELKHIEKIPCGNKDFDKDKFLLNTLDGVVNLLTGELLEHSPAFMMSKNTYTHYNRIDPPTRWIKFIEETTCENTELAIYLQKALGYSLTGSAEEQCFFECLGDGLNGKSVLLDTILTMMGTYAIHSRIETFLDSKYANSGDKATPNIACIAGARLVITDEPKEGSVLNADFIKNLTGGNSITTRKLYGNEFTFTSIAKLWIACNNELIIHGTTYGDWRRVRELPFLNTIPVDKIDKRLEDKLRAEIPSILKWCVDGCVRWENEKLGMPTIIKEATDNYKRNMDIVQKFLDENCIFVPSSREKSTDLFDAYKEWAKLSNEFDRMSLTKFSTELSKHGIDKVSGGKKFYKERIYGYIYYVGICLKKNDKSYYVYKTVSSEDLANRQMNLFDDNDK